MLTSQSKYLSILFVLALWDSQISALSLSGTTCHDLSIGAQSTSTEGPVSQDKPSAKEQKSSQKDEQQAASPQNASQSQAGSNSQNQSQESDISKRVDAIEADLKKQSTTSDFSLQLGIGSLIRNGTLTDYVNNANTLSATALGWGTPQYLVGVSMRSGFPNFGKSASHCTDVSSGKPAVCPAWKQHPWEGFLSIKLSSNASQTLNGYVLGGGYTLMSHFDLLLGFALTPVDVPSPGLRRAASLYVTQQQALGNDLSFNPTAMLNNDQNAFDGFSLVDSSGKLIYSGTPLETDYRGGVVIGVSLPLSFADFLKKGN